MIGKETADTALSLALFASSAAATCAAALRSAGHLDDEIIQNLLETLALTRLTAGDQENVVKHFDLIEGVLAASKRGSR